MKRKSILILTAFLVLGLFLGSSRPVFSAAGADSIQLYLPVVSYGAGGICQFGITIGSGSPAGIDNGALLRRASAGAVIDWGAGGAKRYPGVDYMNVLYTGDHVLENGQSRYQNSLAAIETLVPSNLRQVWLIGNEPDTVYEDQSGSPQDGLLPEEYARRYYGLATRIRQLDSNAKLGFGNVVQPTPIRIRYLRRAWNELVKVTGSQQAASGLIDIWVTHAFILNEQPILDPASPPWGTGIPPGFENDYSDAFVIGGNFALTHSNAIFEQNIRRMRTFMADIGERGKPLWISEYGSLLPPVDPLGVDYVNVSDQDTAAFMTGTFDFLYNTADSASGQPSDGNRLVQRWFWYSLTGPRDVFGGTLFDPDNQLTPTVVGNAYLDYISRVSPRNPCTP